MIQSVASSDVTIANRVGRDSIAINCYAAIEVQTMTALEFLKRAADGKHRIVSSGDLHVMQISEAQANKLFFVDDQTGLGWALVPWELTTAKDRHREAGFFTRGGSGWNTQLHNEACDSEIAEQRKRLASRAALTECAAERDGDCNHDACPQLKDRPLDNAEPSA